MKYRYKDESWKHAIWVEETSTETHNIVWLHLYDVPRRVKSIKTERDYWFPGTGGKVEERVTAEEVRGFFMERWKCSRISDDVAQHGEYAKTTVYLKRWTFHFVNFILTFKKNKISFVKTQRSCHNHKDFLLSFFYA